MVSQVGEMSNLSRASKPKNASMLTATPLMVSVALSQVLTVNSETPYHSYYSFAGGGRQSLLNERRLKATNTVLKKHVVEPSCQQLHCQKIKKQRLVSTPHVAVAIGHSDTTNGERRLVARAMQRMNEVLMEAALLNKGEAAKQRC
jgi:hypothetical protein